jgi:hypothetical protein
MRSRAGGIRRNHGRIADKIGTEGILRLQITDKEYKRYYSQITNVLSCIGILT